MLWTNQLEVAAIEGEQAGYVQTFCRRDYQRVNKVEIGISVLAKNISRTRVFF